MNSIDLIWLNLLTTTLAHIMSPTYQVGDSWWLSQIMMMNCKGQTQCLDERVIRVPCLQEGYRALQMAISSKKKWTCRS